MDHPRLREAVSVISCEAIQDGFRARCSDFEYRAATELALNATHISSAIEVAGGVSHQSSIPGKCSVTVSLAEAMKDFLFARRVDSEYRARGESSVVIRRAVEITLRVADHAGVRVDSARARPELIEQSEGLRRRDRGEHTYEREAARKG